MNEDITDLSENASSLSDQLANLSADIASLGGHAAGAEAAPFLITGLTVFVLACFVGYHVVWRVTPALHSPLMGITNAISSVIIVGAILAVGASGSTFSSALGFIATVLASINIVGGFIITRRMLSMFRKKG